MTVKEFNQLCIRVLGDNMEVIAMEECGELIQAISKAKRDKLDYENLCEEIADVFICLEWIKEKYNVLDEDVQAWVEAKTNRCLERIKTGEFK